MTDHRQNRPYRKNNRREEPKPHIFRDEAQYAISNAEPEPEHGHTDRRTSKVVICRNNPNHVVAAHYIEFHMREECDDNQWRPGKYIPRIPSPPPLEPLAPSS